MGELERSLVNIEDYAMSVQGLTGQVQLIQQVMDKVMKSDEHYGTIPGTNKPTLLKPGAEKLCLTFRLDPDYEIIREVRDKDFIAYTVKCRLSHIPTGKPIASGIGSCNSRETKYRYRHVEESTGTPLPKKYWDARKAGDNKEMKRLLGGDGFRAAKIDNQWVIARSEKIENDNPWDLDNTLIKMACKRALVAATLNATAASDIFTQDVEDMPEELLGGKKTPAPQKQQPEQQPEPEPTMEAEIIDDNGWSDAQRKKIWAMCKTANLSSEESKAFTEKYIPEKDKATASDVIKHFDELLAEFTADPV